MHDFNLALLAKQGWRIIQNPESLLSRVLKAKYFPTSTFLDAKLSGGVSYTWRSIIAGRNLLKSGLRIKIGNGESTSVWRDKWVPIPYSFKAFSFPKVGTEELKVSELLSVDQRGWNIDLLQNLFAREEVEAIASLPLSWSSQKDSLIWHSANDGIYTVRSGYWWWRQYKNREHHSSSSSSSAVVGQLWRRLWHLPMASKIRIFMWKLLHDVIPTKAALRRRHARMTEVTCSLCESEDESALHLFFCCGVVRSFWNYSLIRSDALAAPSGTITEKVWNMLESLASKVEQVYLCVALWAIWSTRNQVVWDGRAFDNLQLVQWVADYIRCYNEANPVSVTEKKRGTVKWKCPPSGRLKMNVDGAFDAETKRGGIGVIVRNDQGVGIASIARSFKYASSALAMEFEACRVGLQLGIDQGWGNLEFESDSILLINALRNHQSDISSIGDVGADCRNLLRRFTLVNITHVFREANEVANRLAHIARNEDIDTMWCEESPAIILDVLLEDLLANSCSIARGSGSLSPPVHSCIQTVFNNNIGRVSDLV